MALRETDRIIKHCFRDADIACRYGGEEFMIILPATRIAEGRLACERLREQIAPHHFKHPASILKIIIRAGLAGLRSNDQATAEALIQRAGAGLYQAKNNGQNRIETVLPLQGE
ncbi:MAG: diguanylate cyclase [Desulfobacterales bacterium]|nr:diguanylate cyclase [Desulfobacterales bacterium]